MVLFLLHNTLGAWWTAKRKAEGLDPVLPGYEWTYLRLKEDGSPAAGSFEGWPRAARDLKVLDPCMGSGHFLVFALPILVGFRMEEEGLSREEAVKAVLRDNLFGLELDNRCTQIAAFNLAWTAWRMVGHCPLPQLNLACSGLGVNAREEDWLTLGGEDERVRETMRRLYHFFEKAPVLGSLIDPGRIGGNLFTTQFDSVRPLLQKALETERRDPDSDELAVAAKGLLEAARILSSEFVLVVTNVPYLGRGKQNEALREYCDEHHAVAKADLATCFIERSLRFCKRGGTTALVTTQYWLYLSTYKAFRKGILKDVEWNIVAKLGSRAFETISGEIVNVALFEFSKWKAGAKHPLAGIDASECTTPTEKALQLRVGNVQEVNQLLQLENPDARLTFESSTHVEQLSAYAEYYNGIQTGDYPRFGRSFWEFSAIPAHWKPQQTTVDRTQLYSGRSRLLLWDGPTGKFLSFVRERLGGNEGAWVRGEEAWNRPGILVSGMSGLSATLYEGVAFDNNSTVLIPRSPEHLSAIWAYCRSEEYVKAIRDLNPKISVTDDTFVRVPFNFVRWKSIAQREFPDGLPTTSSCDITQWLFSGQPKASEQALQAAICRLVGYRWPRQTGSSFMDCPALGPDGLEKHADEDGIVCMASIQGEAAAADRLRALLADAYGAEWSATKQAELLSQVGYAGKSLEDWLRDGFFQQHCELFHQRPFVWHIWDGQRDGFHALVNYHKLAGAHGEGRRTLEKLTYGYLGDWITRQRADQSNGVEGADARVAAAVHLQSELKKIIEGEPPYDIFVRWKPLDEQPIGWEPDINDGVRLNIRPFMTAKALKGRGKGASILRVLPKGIKWEKDRGKEPHRAKEDFPWFWSWDGQTQDFTGGREFDGNRWNDLHYSIQKKKEAREAQNTAQSRKGAAK
jgi:hypothetical protein